MGRQILGGGVHQEVMTRQTYKCLFGNQGTLRAHGYIAQVVKNKEPMIFFVLRFSRLER